MEPGAAVTPTVLVRGEQLLETAVVVDGDAYRHLFRARRLAIGDVVRLVDGRGAARYATVQEVDRRRAVLQAGEVAPANDALRRVELLVAAPRPERAAWLVEKATELGVAAVRFLASERGVRGVDAKALERLRRVAAAALEQCGGARLPELSGRHAMPELPTLLGQAAAWYLDPAEDGLLVGGTGPVAVLIGPEGGWSAADLAAIRAAGVRGATLGNRILRVETAAVVAAALLLSRRE